MLHDFVEANRARLVERCKAKVSARAFPPVTAGEADEAVPLFIGQLVEALRAEDDAPPLVESRRVARWHGQHLFDAGYTVGQVVHDYGDICQALTELAKEDGARVTVDEFRILNKLLDDAIADAVSSYERGRDRSAQVQGDSRLHERIGALADEQRALVDRALAALEALQAGNIGLRGATGGVLEDSLRTLRATIDRSLPEIRLLSRMTSPGAP